MYTSQYNVEVYIDKKVFKSYSYAIIRVSLGAPKLRKVLLSKAFFFACRKAIARTAVV